MKIEEEDDKRHPRSKFQLSQLNWFHFIPVQLAEINFCHGKWNTPVELEPSPTGSTGNDENERIQLNSVQLVHLGLELNCSTGNTLDMDQLPVELDIMGLIELIVFTRAPTAS